MLDINLSNQMPCEFIFTICYVNHWFLYILHSWTTYYHHVGACLNLVSHPTKISLFVTIYYSTMVAKLRIICCKFCKMVVKTAIADIRIPFPQLTVVWSSSLSHGNKHFLSAISIVYHPVFENFDEMYNDDGVYKVVPVFNLKR